MNNIIGQRISSQHFDYDRMTHTFSQDASMLNYKGFGWVSQLYNDSCDEGFVMVSINTGQAVAFRLKQDCVDEGERKVWTYYPIPEHVRKYNLPADLRVLVFNT